MRLIKTYLLNTSIVVGLTLVDVVQLVHASSYQRLIDFAYENPAIINVTVKNAEATIGNSLIYGLFTYKGEIGSLSGTAPSKQLYNYPYGRLAHRFDPKWVGAVDVTHLEYINIVFPVDGVTQFAATSIVLHSVDVTPKISYFVNKNLAIGAAMNIDTTYTSKLNNVVDPNGELQNHSSDDQPAFGWGLGAVYSAPTKTTIELSYFSKITHHTSGTSTWGMIQNKDYTISYPLPGIATLGIAQAVQEKWLIKGILRYQWWGIFNNLVLENTALGRDIVINESFNNTLVSTLGVHYQATDKLGLTLGGEHHQSPQLLAYRSAGLASYKSDIIGGGFDYAFTKTVRGQFIYSHSFSNPPINRESGVGLQKGREIINGNNFDFTLTWHI